MLVDDCLGALAPDFLLVSLGRLHDQRLRCAGVVSRCNDAFAVRGRRPSVPAAASVSAAFAAFVVAFAGSVEIAAAAAFIEGQPPSLGCAGPERTSRLSLISVGLWTIDAAIA